MENKEYFAFISYQRKDEEWAEWLRHRLEHYHLPLSLRKKDPSLPKEIRPIFRDSLELAGGVLSEEIQLALEHSKYLIVICSPNSAKSTWVNKEVEMFLALGRSRYIIPVIIDGTAFSDDRDSECFTPALKSMQGERELLGISINELGREAAAVKVVARMLDLRFDTLWQRYEKEKKKQRRVILGSSLLATLAILVAATLIIMGMKQREWKMLANQSRYEAETALNLAEQGDFDMAQKLAAAVLPGKLSLPSKRPYIPRAEYALRKAWSSSGRVLRGHEYIVTFVAFSSDGEFIVSGSGDGAIKLWDANTCELVWETETETETEYRKLISSGAISPDSKRIACGLQVGTIQLYDAESGSLIWMQRVDLRDPNASDGLGYLYSIGYVNSVAFSPDGRFIVCATSDGIISFMNAEDGHQIWGRQTKKKEEAYSVTFSPEGNCILLGTADCISLYDTKNGDIIWAKTMEESVSVLSIAFSPDGRRFITGLGNGILRLWDSETGKAIWDAEAGDAINSVAFSPDGQHIATGSSDGTVRIWDALNGKQQQIHIVGQGILSVAFSPDGRFVISGAYDKTVRLWEASTDEQVRIIKCGDEQAFRSVAFSLNDQFIISQNDWDDDTGHLSLWDAKSGNKIWEKTDLGSLAIALSPDGKFTALGSKEANSVFLLKAVTGELLWVNGLEEKPDIHSLAFSQDGKLLVSSLDDEVFIVWNTVTGEQVLEKKVGDELYVPSVVFSPDGQSLLSATDKMTLWSVKTGETVWETKMQTNSICSAVCFRPDGETIVAGYDDGIIRQLDAKTGNQIWETKDGHYNSVSSVAYSPTGRYVVSGSWDCSIRIWDAKTGEPVRDPLLGHEDPIHSVAFSSDGRQIISGSWDNTVRVWEFVSLDSLLNRTGRLTPEERERFFLE